MTGRNRSPAPPSEHRSEAGSLTSVPIRRARGDRFAPAIPKPGDLTRELGRRRLDAREHAAPETAAAPLDPPAEAAPRATLASGDLLSYWSLQRRGRQHPARDDLDGEWIAAQWPGTLLLRFSALEDRLEFAQRFTAPPGTPRRGVEFTPMVLEWVLALGRKVGRAGRPLAETESFPVALGPTRLRAVALPLGASPGAVDYVLCHVAPA